MEPSAVQFDCQHCGKRYAWTREIAGRRLHCACGQTLVVPQAPAALGYRQQDAVQPGESHYFADPVKDLWMPLAFVAIGTVIEIALGFFGRRGGVEGALAGGHYVGVKLVVNTIAMLIAILILGKLRGISFGPMPTALLKLCGISIGPGAIGTLVGVMFSWMPLGIVLGWIAGFVLYFAAIGALFDLDQEDTWWCVVTIFVVKIAVAMVVVRLLS
jgi:hypothetical protein